ncbi:MAG: hypothetical protein FWE67_05745 [Planctomycetaceae bacterium]|nr:hypothetical protein [Planctomycetaceae bacterium]
MIHTLLSRIRSLFTQERIDSEAWRTYFLYAVTLLIFASGISWIRANAMPFPCIDAIIYVEVLAGQRPLDFDFLWEQFGFHRLVLTKLWYLFTAYLFSTREPYMCATNYCWLLLATISCLWTAKEVRGRLSCFDLFFPALLLTPTFQFENLRQAFQGWNILPAAIFIIAGSQLIYAVHKQRTDTFRSLLLAASVAALPLCNAGHIFTGGCLAAAILLHCFPPKVMRHANPIAAIPVFNKIILLFGILCYAGAVLALMLDYEPHEEMNSLGVLPALLTSFRLFGCSLLGPMYPFNLHYTAAFIFMLVTLAAAVFLLVARFYRFPEERRQLAVLFFLLFGSGLLIGSVAWGRNNVGIINMAAPRLVTHCISAQIFLFFIFTIYASEYLKRILLSGMAVCLFLGIINIGGSTNYSLIRDKIVSELWASHYADIIRGTVLDDFFPICFDFNGFSDVPNLEDNIIGSRLGVLRVIHPLYTFEDLQVIRKFEPLRKDDAVLFSAELSDEVEDGLKIKAFASNASLVFRSIEVPAGCIAVARLELYHCTAGKRFFIYHCPDTGIPFSVRGDLLEHPSRADIALDIFGKGRNAKLPSRRKPIENFQRTLLHGIEDEYQYIFPLPAEYIIRSAEFRALPIVR